MAHAASGTYTGLGSSLGSFLIALLAVAVFYPVRQVVVQSLILVRLCTGVVRSLIVKLPRIKMSPPDFLEAVAYLTTALFLNSVVTSLTIGPLSRWESRLGGPPFVEAPYQGLRHTRPLL